MYNIKTLKDISAFMLKNKETIAIAESVTGGMLQHAFSNMPDASKFFQGGITAYNLGQKYKHLAVEPLHALEVNCVSASVAEQMAINVCELFGSTWGIGVTGYATPSPASGEKLFAYYAICHKGLVVAQHKITSVNKEPLDVQLFYVNKIISKILETGKR